MWGRQWLEGKAPDPAENPKKVVKRWTCRRAGLNMAIRKFSLEGAPMLRARVLLFALAAAASSVRVAVADIIITNPASEIDRHVATSANGVDLDSSMNMAAGPFSYTAMSSGLGVNSVSATASQISTIDVNSMTGAGVSVASIIASDSSWSLSAESYFSVQFEVDVATTFSFSAEVTWTSSMGGLGGFSEVSLLNVTTATDVVPPVMRSVGLQGTDSMLPTLVMLIPTVQYRLTALTQISGSEFVNVDDANGEWSFTLTAVPEAGSAALLSPIILGAALGAWWRRRR
jgi:hypothetical protein